MKILTRNIEDLININKNGDWQWWVDNINPEKTRGLNQKFQGLLVKSSFFLVKI